MPVTRMERTMTMGTVTLGYLDNGGVAVSIDNRYSQPRHAQGRDEIEELGNTLVVTAGDADRVEHRVTRADCLRLAQMFLTAALHPDWPADA